MTPLLVLTPGTQHTICWLTPRRLIEEIRYSVLKKDQAQAFTEYLNTIDEDIKWMTEGEVQQELEVADMGKKVEWCLAFLDTLSVINDNGTIRTREFRKATHTDLYLNFDNNHPLEYKWSVVRTLTHRARFIVRILGKGMRSSIFWPGVNLLGVMMIGAHRRWTPLIQEPGQWIITSYCPYTAGQSVYYTTWLWWWLPRKNPVRSHGYNPHTEYQYPLLTTWIPVNPASG